LAVHQSAGELVAQTVTQSKRLHIEDVKPRSNLAPLRLVLRICDGNDLARIVSIPMQEKLVVGRSGQNSERPPEIDLAAFHGLENGVSRWHARFAYNGEFLAIEDLNSTNGTRINGFQIAPARLYRLRNGDEIEIGRVRLTVSVVHIPVIA